MAVHDSFEISRAELDSLVAVVKTYGAKVEEVWEEPEGARFIGTFEGHLIRLFPKHDSNFALSQPLASRGFSAAGASDRLARPLD